MRTKRDRNNPLASKEVKIEKSVMGELLAAKLLEISLEYEETAQLLRELEESQTLTITRKDLPQLLSQGGYYCSDFDNVINEGVAVPDDSIHFHYPSRGNKTKGFVMESKDYRWCKDKHINISEINDYNDVIKQSLDGANPYPYSNYPKYSKWRQLKFAAHSFNRGLYKYLVLNLEFMNGWFALNVYDLENNEWVFDQMQKTHRTQLKGFFAKAIGLKLDLPQLDPQRVGDFLETPKEIKESAEREAKRKEALGIMRVKLTENERINQMLAN